MKKVLFICHGNICRSTMAQSVFSYLVKQKGLESQFIIDSAATSYEEIGNYVHSGTVKELNKQHIPVIEHYARRMSIEDYEKFDYLIGMDEANISNMKRICEGDDKGKIYKLMNFCNRDKDVADPWYTNDFHTTYLDIYEGCNELLKQIIESL